MIFVATCFASNKAGSEADRIAPGPGDKSGF